MPEKCKRHFLKTREARTLLRKASERLRTNLESHFKDRLDFEVLKTMSREIFLIDGKPVLIKTERDICPTLKFDEYLQSAPKVIVDMGAVPYICKGADVMAPGIRRIEGQFERNSIVSVADERHGRRIAVGEILYSSEEAGKIKLGTVVRNLHYVGDRTWSLLKELNSRVR